MRNKIHGQLISNGYVIYGQCVWDDTVDTWQVNGNACKMFAKCVCERFDLIMFDVLDMSIGVDFIDVKETLEARFDVDDDYNYAYADMECMRIDKLVCGYAMRIALE